MYVIGDKGFFPYALYVQMVENPSDESCALSTIFKMMK